MVEVCVGRQVDRVRGRERRQAGEQEQVINNRRETETAEVRDIQPYSAKAEQYGESGEEVIENFLEILFHCRKVHVSCYQFGSQH